MKKTIFLVTTFLFLTSSIFANTTLQPIQYNSMYLGLQTGLSYDGLKNKNQLEPGLTLKRNKDINLSGRLFVGYNLNKNFALEGGFLFTDQNELKVLINSQTTAKFKIKESILDFTPRINIPMGKFTVYGRAGIAYIDAFNTGKDKKDFNLTYGLGLDYKITNDLSTGVIWNHYNGGSTKPIDIIYGDYQPSLNFIGLSISYKI